MIRVARVSETQDSTMAGVFKASIIDSTGALSDKPVSVLYSSPNIGDDCGILTIPGPGTLVLIEDAQHLVESISAYLKNDGVPSVKWVYQGAVPTQLVQRFGQASTSNAKDNADDGNNTQKDVYGRDPNKSRITVDTGIPNAGMVYADNDLPQQDIWKTRNGHKFVMSHKISSTRHDNSILLESAGGKQLRIDEGPPEMKMDKIILKDENGNFFQIVAGGDHPDSSELHTKRDQTFTSERGCSHSTIMGGSTGDFKRENFGTGDICDTVAHGNHLTDVQTDIRRFSHAGDVLEVAGKGDITYNAKSGSVYVNGSTRAEVKCGNSVITLLPDSITISSPSITLDGTVQVQTGTTTLTTGVVLDTHVHGGVIPGGSSTTGPQ